MKRAILRALCPAFALGFALFAATGAQAELINYLATGTFDSSGTSTYTSADGKATITYSVANFGVNLTSSNPSSLVSFGTFNTSGTSATTPDPVSSGFTLNIFDLSPAGGSINFVGTLHGTLEINSSGAYIQFASPLSGTLNGALLKILSADGGNMGRVNLAPSTTNGGASTIAGQVSMVPEPSSMAMLALGASASVLIGLRSRRRMLQTVA